MKTIFFLVAGMLATAFVGPAMLKSEKQVDSGFTFANVIPNDVYMYAATRHNAEREFLDQYWGEVIDALKQSGVGADVADIFGMFIDRESELGTELERIKSRVMQLVVGVDWEQLAGTETVFAERFSSSAGWLSQQPPIMVTDMVVLFRGSGEGAARNYDGLVAILDAMVEEVNKAAGAQVLKVDRRNHMGAKVSSVNLLAALPGVRPLPLSVALRGDVVILGLRAELLDDVLAMMNGSSAKPSLGSDPRFQAAFAQLPPAEDLMSFFDMHALMEPLRAMFDSVANMAGGTDDSYRNTGQNAEASKVNGQAMAAYQSGDVKKALTLIQRAHAIEPADSIITYNLACFSALAGQKEPALQALSKAVEAGFHAPGKIASDSDLKSLRDDPRYQAALARAGALAAVASGRDVVRNSADNGEVRALTLQAWQVYEDKDFAQGLKLCEQAYAIAPKDSRVLYALACFHSLLGHEDKALDFLEESVQAGFYSPRHIRKDADLESLRGHARYEAAVALAEERATALSKEDSDDKKAIILGLINRIADAAEILDYSASVVTTDGYSVWSEVIAVLVPDAKERAIYPVFGKRPQLTDFDKYLPAETQSFAVAGGIDVGELYTFIEDTVRLVGPKGEELLQKWAGLQEAAGVNLRKDVLDWIGGDSINVTLADNAGSVWLMKVSNDKVAREKVGAAIEFVATSLTQLAGKNPAFAGLAMLGLRTSPTTHKRLEGFQNIHIAMSPDAMVWGVADGFLIFGTSADAVALCLATAAGDHPNIRSNATAMSEAIVPEGRFAAVSLTDQRGMGEEIAMALGMGSMGLGMAGAFVPDPEIQPVFSKISGILSKLVPVAQKINFYKSSANLVTFDGQMWRVRTVTHYFSPDERSARNAG